MQVSKTAPLQRNVLGMQGCVMGRGRGGQQKRTDELLQVHNRVGRACTLLDLLVCQLVVWYGTLEAWVSKMVI